MTFLDRTKACVIADAIGRVVAFVLAPGQAHELPYAAALLDCLPGVPKWAVADRGYSSHAFREHIWNLGAARHSRPSETRKPSPVRSELQQPLARREPVGQIEGMASRRHTQRENRPIFHGRAFPRRRLRLDQMLTGPDPIQPDFLGCRRHQDRGRGRSTAFTGTSVSPRVAVSILH